LIYFERGNYANAVQEFTQVIQRVASADAYMARGYANAMQGNVEQAIQDMERALQLGASGAMRTELEEMLRVLRGQ